MRNNLSLLVLIIVVLSLLPLTAVNAESTNQFAGCASEEERELGLRITAIGLNGFTMQVTAIGKEEFDPQVTIVDQDGEVVTCSDDSSDAAEVAVNLPTVEAGPAETTARASVRVPGDEGRLDYEIYITSADGNPGEFVMMYSGAVIRPATEKDDFIIHTTDAQAAAEVPLGIYVANLQRAETALDPTVTFTFGEDFEQYCGKSSASSLCDGDHEDLTGYTVTLEEEEPLELTGNDVMLNFTAGNEAADFTISVGSYSDGTFGPYTLIIHSGVAAPPEG